MNFKEQTANIVSNLYREYAGLKKISPDDFYTLNIKEEIDLVLNKYKFIYSEMIRKTTSIADEECFIKTVASSVFSDGINWGRILSFIAFGASIVYDIRKTNTFQRLNSVIQAVVDYLTANLEEWIKKNKGWNGFLEFYGKEQDHTVKILTLLILGGLVGLITLI